MSSRFPMRAARALPEPQPIKLRWWPSDDYRQLLVGEAAWRLLTDYAEKHQREIDALYPSHPLARKPQGG